MSHGGGGYYPKANINSEVGSNVTFAGNFDPRVILVPAIRGSRFFQLDRTNVGPIEIFVKLDNDVSSFNWAIETGSLPGPPGPTGPPGPPGPPGTASDLYNADLSVAIGDVVYISSANTVSPAIANDVNKKYSIGVCISKPSPTQADVKSVGLSPGVFTGLTPNSPVFLSPTVLGSVTQTPPTGAGIWRQILGVAASSTQIHLLIQEPIRRS